MKKCNCSLIKMRFFNKIIHKPKYLRRFILSVVLLSFVGCGFFAQGEQTGFSVIDKKDFEKLVNGQLKELPDFVNIFPKSSADVEKRVEYAIDMAKLGIKNFLDIRNEDRTFENTARAYDKIEANFGVAANSIDILEMVSPDEKIRKACHDASLKLREFAVDAFYNMQIYKAFKDYVQGNSKKEKLNNEEKYFLEESMKDFVRSGFDLPEDEFFKVKELKKEISKLGLEFETNVNTDKSEITVKREELDGLEPEFIDSLKKDGEGDYILGCDYPTYFEVLENCKISDIRKKLYLIFQNRAYPKNKKILDDIIEKRDVLANKLGFDSFASLELSSQMVKTPKVAYDFLSDLAKKTMIKTEQEFKQLVRDLPEDITLDQDGKMEPWDFSFVKNNYKKKHFNVDEREIAKYFPVQNTLDKIFEIYQKFLGLEFKFVEAEGLWHKDVKVVQVFDKETNQMRGVLFLDLYPRDNKYGHACMADIVPTTGYKDLKTGQTFNVPSLIVVIGNFPKATKDRPALLKHSDVETFFHEFGHAMHGLLGKTELTSFSGTSVKRDFVEMPSQMFEEWMWDKDILKSVSCHYETKESLPDELINKKLELKKFGSGFFVTRQCWLSLIALDYFASGQNKDTDKIKEDLHNKYIKNIRFEPETHFQMAFGHLVGYGAKYYGYMWSKVFALDLFAQVKKYGLLDRKIGQKFECDVLAKGGSVDPSVLLRDFLGREPNQKAFLEDIGVS